MNTNISVYIVFLALMVFIIVYVGRYFYCNGRVFILSLLKGNAALTDSINNLLLTGYYLLNIGYSFIKLRTWPRIINLEQWLSSLAENMAILILLLAGLHYFNMLAIYFFSKKYSLTHKSLQS
jgi:hypothetical protein